MGKIMQITEKLGQYSRNVTNGTEELRSAQGAQKMVSTAGELSAGSIFEGTVNHVRNGKVTLALGNGQQITARMSGKVDIQPGSSMFFQVKSNDGATVEIRPYTGTANAANPILLNALTAAKVPVTERNLAMVDAMMREQLPIGKQGILNMLKVISGNPGIDVSTAVTMTKLGLPVTEQMAAQFENYLAGRQAVLGEMELVLNQLTAALGDESLSPEAAFALYSRILDSLSGGDGQPSAGGMPSTEAAGAGTEGVFVLPGETAGDGQAGPGAGMVSGAGEPSGGGAAVQAPTQGQTGTAFIPGLVGAEDQTGAAAAPGTESESASGIPSDGRNLTEVSGEKIFADMQLSRETATAGKEVGLNITQLLPEGSTLGEIFDTEQLGRLTKLLQSMPELAGSSGLFYDGGEEEIFVDTMQGENGGRMITGEEYGARAAARTALNPDMTAGEFLNAVRKALEENRQNGFPELSRLFSGKEFQALFRNVIKEQWLMKPGELTKEDMPSGLFEKIERQLGQMEAAVRASGSGQNAFAQAAADVRGNIEFMNQMNQIYTYIQMPLKMSGQSANGELYVYTNKKQLRDPEAELTAFLHLDLDHLGSTDVSVRMQKKQVTTNFYFSDLSSFGLVEKHLPILEKHLKNKGYNCKITISKEKKEADPMESFLKGGRTQNGSLHRYSFDVRA